MNPVQLPYANLDEQNPQEDNPQVYLCSHCGHANHENCPAKVKLSEKTKEIETTINDEFSCYYCLVYFIPINCIFLVIGLFFNNGSELLVILKGLAIVFQLLACLSVLTAKQSFDTEWQEIGVIGFYAGCISDLLCSLIVANQKVESINDSRKPFWADPESSQILTLCLFPIFLLAYSYIITASKQVAKLMKDREQFIKSTGNLDQDPELLVI